MAVTSSNFVEVILEGTLLGTLGILIYYHREYQRKQEMFWDATGTRWDAVKTMI